MSLITNLIDRLRANGSALCAEAANMIEELSAKLFASQMERSSMYYHDGWIPVSERLPDMARRNVYGEIAFSDPVWVCQQYGGEDGYSWQSIDQCNKDGTWMSEVPFDDPMERCKVTAWQPLPEPYKESKK